LRRVSIFSNKSTNQVVLNIHGSELQLNGPGRGLLFEGSERMKCQYDGEDSGHCLQCPFLIEMLASADSDEVRMELSTPPSRYYQAYRRRRERRSADAGDAADAE